MVSLTPYTQQLSSNLTQTMICGSHQFTFNFIWNDVAQEQYDLIESANKRIASSDPLYNTETREYDRDYDYIEYYVNLDLDTLDDLTILPQSLYKLSNRVTLASQRKTECELLYQQRQHWEQLLRWSFSLIENSETIMTGVVNSGASFVLSDSNLILFLSNYDIITEDDLSKIYVVFLEYD